MKEFLIAFAIAISLVLGVLVFIVKVTDTSFAKVSTELIDHGVVIKLLVREETATRGRVEYAIIEATTSRHKVISDFYVIGDSVEVHRQTGGGLPPRIIAKLKR